MKENANKYLDHLIGDLVKEVKIESPSRDFTNKVMSQIKGLQTSRVTVYEPLISKTSWILILLGFLALVVVVFLISPESSTPGWFEKINFNFFKGNTGSQLFSDVNLPKSLLIPLLFFSLLIWVQVPILRNYYSKRLDY